MSNEQTQGNAEMTNPQPQGNAEPAPKAEAQSIAAVGFLVLGFLDEKAADQALDVMKDAKKKKEFYFEDAAVIRQDAQGKVHYHETGDMSTGRGAGIGALVGGVLGLLGGPAGVALGAGAGAAVGAAVASHDAGFRNESLNTVGVALMPGTSAVVAITSREFLKAVQQQVPIEDIRTLVRRLGTELSARLRENKNVAIGMLLTEDGLGIREIAVDEKSAEIVGAVITDEGVLAGAAVVTAEGAVVTQASIPADAEAAAGSAAPDEAAAKEETGHATPEAPAAGTSESSSPPA